jgi:cell division protein ZapA
MSNVDLSIAGRNFTVACAAGEEDHVASLGRLIDSKLQSMGGAAGQSESRALLFAALLLADELHEAKGAGGSSPASAPTQAQLGGDPDLLEAIATRLENIAERLEG